jgi:hypothetical protein
MRDDLWKAQFCGGPEENQWTTYGKLELPKHMPDILAL